jgi:N6-L-threonylcarbamoyladenine synthase
MGEMPGLDFSFSGIKTAILYFLQKEVKLNPDFIEENKADICASVQKTLIEILLRKVKKAMREKNCSSIAIAGGVSANSGLRKRLQELGEENHWEVYIPAFSYCTDNAGMIAMAGHFKFKAGEFCEQNVSPLARYPW